MAFTIYKIYYNCGLVYVGKTKQARLNDRLRGHFFKKPMMRNIDIEAVTKIEYTELTTECDMSLYEVYYICKLKPMLNGISFGRDNLTAELPPLVFKNYECNLMDKWKAQITENDRQYKEREAAKRTRAANKRALWMRRRRGEITEEEYWDRIEEIGMWEGETG